MKLEKDWPNFSCRPSWSVPPPCRPLRGHSYQVVRRETVNVFNVTLLQTNVWVVLLLPL